MKLNGFFNAIDQLSMALCADKLRWIILRKLNALIALSIIILGSSCGTPEFLSKKELEAYIQDETNGLSKSVQVGEVLMKVRYHPNDFVILEQMEEVDDFPMEDIKQLSREYVYFVLELDAGQRDIIYGVGMGESQLKQEGQILPLELNEYVSLTTSVNDTIPVEDFYPFMMFETNSGSDILFIFSRKKFTDSQTITFNLKEFGFNTGDQTFSFDVQKISESPKLRELRLMQNKSTSRKALRRGVFGASL